MKSIKPLILLLIILVLLTERPLKAANYSNLKASKDNLNTKASTATNPILIYNLSVGTTASGDSLGTICLSWLQSGVTYQLFKDGIAYGSPVIIPACPSNLPCPPPIIHGTSGCPVSWKNLAGGTYTVQAFNGVNYAWMNGSIVFISVINIGGSGNYCTGNTDPIVTINNSQIGVNYQLLKGGAPTGILKTGNGSSIHWNNTLDILTSGTYTVQAQSGSTTKLMNGSAVVAINPTPNTPTISVHDSCGYSSLTTTSNGGILWNTGANTSSIKVNTAGTYSVSQTLNGCTSADGIAIANPTIAVKQHINIIANANPVMVGNPVTITATVNNSSTNDNYYWYVNGVLKNSILSNTYSYNPSNNDAVKCIITPTGCFIGDTSSQLTIHINTTKKLKVKLMLWGLYIGFGEMNQTSEFDTNIYDIVPKFAYPKVDTLSVVILGTSATNYAVIAEFNGVNLGNNGSLDDLILPATITGSNYIVINHRNSIETWSDSVSFADTVIYYDFYSHVLSSEFPGNMYLESINGTFVGSYIWSGDVIKDGTVNIFDLSEVFDLLNDPNSPIGYSIDDLNGDSVINIYDLSIVFDNLNLGATALTPFTLKK